MLAAEGLLNVLSVEIDDKDYKNDNNDYNFSEVLKHCGDHNTPAHALRYADGQEELFSFDK